MKYKPKLRPGIFLLFTLLIFLTAYAAVPAHASERPVYVVELEGAITAGQSNYLERQISNALEDNAQLFVLQMNTPGGLVDATLSINQLFLNARIPIAVLVAPSGAIAGSAGAFIIISADIAAMAPGTTVGAAQPIAFSPEGTEPAEEKTVIFYANHLRSMAQEKGRPEDIAEKFVTENLTLTAGEALAEGVIEYLVNDITALLAAVDGLTIDKQGVSYTLNTEDAPLVMGEMTIAERLQNWVSDPQIAFMILMLGILGIYFGLSAPGTLVPEVTGSILLILGIYGIGLFDTNTTGVILLLAGVGLIVAEIFTSGFGIFGIAGAASLVAGAILLPLEPLMARDWYTTFLITVVGTVLGLVLVVIFVAQRIIHSRRTWTGGSAYFNPPETGIVAKELNPDGMIKARGELWKAHSEDEKTIPIGTEVEVVRAKTLNLWVRPLQKEQKPEEEENRGH
jgi:membrane-bound serine protease (ClpP class)